MRSPTTLLRTIRSSFAGLEDGRLFFNNAAGAMRLKAVMELQRELTALPDYPSGGAGEPARRLLDAMEEGKRALRLLLDAPEGGQIVHGLCPPPACCFLWRTRPPAAGGERPS